MANGQILTLGDMVCQARIFLDDEPEDTGFASTNLELITEAAEGQDETNLLWKDAELFLYANEAVREVALRTMCLGLTTGVAGFNSFAITAAGEPWQALSDKILRVLRFTWDGNKLAYTSKNRLDECHDDWETETGEPTHLVWDEATKQVRVYPRNTVDGTLLLEVRHYPRTIMTAKTDVPVIPEHMRMPAVYWVCHLAYLKNDADTKDPQQSERFAALFAAEFGSKPSLRSIEFNRHALGRLSRGKKEFW